MPSASRYDRIGEGYATTRRPDPRLAARIEAALGPAQRVVNVGAGAGSYEPTDRFVVAVEPSAVMIAQRPASAAPVIRAVAQAIPLADDAVDAAMAVLTVHHWDGAHEHGVREMRRVARDRVAIVTYDPIQSGQMWLMAEYLPEVAILDHKIFPAPETIAGWLGEPVQIEPMPIPADCTDWMLGSFWAHPERVLDRAARDATSGFARQSPDVIDRVVRQLSHDLEHGIWDRKWGDLRALPELDVGLRLVVGRA